MTAEQVLQNSIIELQRQGFCADTRRLADEAAQLLASGRDIEATALVEKAQAIAVPDAHPKENGVTRIDGPRGAGLEQTLISQVSSRLAQGITSLFTEAMEELYHGVGAQVDVAVRSLWDQLAEITTQLKTLPHLHKRVDRFEQDEAARARVTPEQWDGLSASVASLQEADQSRKAEAEEFRQHVSIEIRTISGRAAAQEARLDALDHLVQSLSSKVMSVAEQTDRHTALIKTMQERQAHRAAALNGVLDGLAKLRESRSLANEGDDLS